MYVSNPRHADFDNLHFDGYQRRRIYFVNDGIVERLEMVWLLAYIQINVIIIKLLFIVLIDRRSKQCLWSQKDRSWVLIFRL